MFGPYAGTEVTEESLVGVAHPEYTVAERALLDEAKEILTRAWEGGHFSDLLNESRVLLAVFHGGKTAHSLAALHRAAERAQALVPEGVSVVARSTALGDRILVGIKGRP